MSIHRHAAQRDDNEPDIVDAFERLGWRVVRHAAYDLAVQCPRNSRCQLSIEVKKLKPKGTLTKSQQQLIESGWSLHIVREVDDVLRLTQHHLRQHHG